MKKLLGYRNPVSQRNRVSTTIAAMVLLWGFSAKVTQAQTRVTELNATYIPGTGGTSGDYKIVGVKNNPTSNHHRFNVGSDNNLKLNSFVLSGSEFDLIRLVSQINLNRVDNAQVTGKRDIIFYERGPNYSLPNNLNVKPSAATTMEEALLSDLINRGTDNVFANQGNGDGNNNNIERIDFTEPKGLSAPGDNLKDIGFLILERGGNDNFKIAAITELDATGKPSKFGKLISVTTESQWGQSNYTVVTEVMRKDPSDANLRYTATIGDQKISAIFFSYDDLGITGNQKFYGYALFPPDINSNANLVDYAKFPTNTSDGSNAGGMDLMAGGGIFAVKSVKFTDLEISKTDGRTTITPGSPISYTITIKNNGPVSVTSLTIADPLPASIQGVSYTPSTGTYDKSTGKWTGLNLGSGQSITLTVSGTLSSTATGTITNTATVFPPSGIVDSNYSNNSSTDTTTVVASKPNILLVKRITAINTVSFTDVVDGVDNSNSPNYVPPPRDADDNNPNWLSGYLQGRLDGGKVSPGDELEWTIYFLSTGNDTAPKVLLCDRIPNNTSFVPTFNSGTGSDRGLVLNYNGTTVSLTNAQDGDVGQYFPPGLNPATVYPKINCGGANTNGAVVVNLGDLPQATSAGTPPASFGYIRFRGRVK